MKKLILSTILAVLFVGFYGQTPWTYGLKLGINFTTISGKWSNNDDTKNGWIGTPVVGLLGGYNFNENLSVNAELNLAKWGAIYKNTWTDESGQEVEGRFRERYTNLQIPIMARYTIGEEWRFSAHAGFYLSKILCGKYVDKVEAWNYEQSGKIKYGEEPENYDGDDWYLSKDENRRIDIGVLLGGGVEREVGPGLLGLELRASYGFLDYYKWPDNDQADGYKGYNNWSLSLSARYVPQFFH